MSKKPATTGEITPEIIEQWMDEYDEVHMLSVANTSIKYDPHAVIDDDADIDGWVCYIRKPNDKEMNFAMSKLPAMLDAGKVIVKSCWLGGDEEIKTNVPAFNAAAMQALEFLEVRQAKLKKLSRTGPY